MIVFPDDLGDLNKAIVARAQRDIPILESARRLFLSPAAVFALVLNLGCGVPVAYAAIARTVPFAQTHAALTSTVDVRDGRLCSVEMATAAMSRGSSLPLAALAAGDIHLSCYRLQVARVDALTVTAKVVEVEAVWNRSNHQHVSDAMAGTSARREQFAITQTDPRIPLLSAARPNAARVRIRRCHLRKPCEKVGSLHPLQSMTYRFASKGRR